MKIATYNVNSINARLPIVLKWLAETQPDVVCFQELKTPDEKFPADEIKAAGYQAIWHGQKSYNGVAILSKYAEVVEICRGLPGDNEDLQSRYIEAMINGIAVCCLYLPNGNPAPGPKFDYKTQWFYRFGKRAQTWLEKGVPAVITGDYNVIPQEIDAYKPERWVEDALFRPETRAAYADLLKQGWTDALRHLYPTEIIYTYWDYFRDAFGRNAGIRIDHFLLSPDLKNKLKAGGVDKNVRAWEKSSDHAPVWIELDV